MDSLGSKQAELLLLRTVLHLVGKTKNNAIWPAKGAYDPRGREDGNGAVSVKVNDPM